MTRLFRCALLLFLSSACAPTAKVSSGPGSSAATRMYRVNALAFEAPAPFSAEHRTHRGPRRPSQHHDVVQPG